MTATTSVLPTQQKKQQFKTWSPLAEKVTLNLYSKGNGDTLIKSVDMTLGDKGVWTAEEAGDLNGVYYTYTFKINGSENEAVDLYARAGGVNGDRGMIIDLKSTNPDGWDSDVRPEFGGNATDAIVYEQHVRDFSIDASSGVSDAHKGKYLAFTETGTKNSMVILLALIILRISESHTFRLCLHSTFQALMKQSLTRLSTTGAMTLRTTTSQKALIQQTLTTVK